MKKRLALLGSAILVLAVTFGFSLRQEASATVPGVNQLVSQDSSGNWANGTSSIGSPHSVSGDGRYVVFTSSASNLVSGDSNGHSDVFVRDTTSDTTTLVDVSNSGTQADNGASAAAISYDGRFVVFQSTATNLVSGVSGQQVYERDLTNNTTVLVSSSSSGVAAYGVLPDVNADGRYVTFITNGTGLSTLTGQINYGYTYAVVKDTATGAITLIGSAGAQGSAIFASLDCDGHVIALMSGAHLTSNTPSNSDQSHGYYNYYYATVDWSANSLTYLDNIISTEYTSPQVSCNGNDITYADTVGNVFEYNRLTSAAAYVNSGTDNSNNTLNDKRAISLSDDGRYVAYISAGTYLDRSYSDTDRGPNYDVFVRDMKASGSQLVTFTTSGNMSGLVPWSPLGASISPDGSKVVYDYATPSSSGSGSELISGVDTGQQDVYESETGF